MIHFIPYNGSAEGSGHELPDHFVGVFGWLRFTQWRIKKDTRMVLRRPDIGHGSLEFERLKNHAGSFHTP